MDIVKLKISDIIADENQPRKKFDKESLQELANSIIKYGLLQPIIVTKIGDKYRIIAGERRYKACKIAKLEYIDAIIKQDENVAQIALIENIQRENLTAIEEAQSIMSLKNSNNYTHEQLSKMLGKTRTYITNKLRILGIDDDTKKLLQEDKISEGHARALLSEKDVQKRKQLAQKILMQGLSVRQTEKQVQLLKIQAENEIYTSQEDEEIIQILEDKLSTKISIEKQSEDTGSIIIDFYSSEQLQDIIEKMCK